MTTITFGETKMGAIIFTGDEFDNDGQEIEQALIGKGYDVHITQIHSHIKYFEISDWSETPLVKSLEKEGHYDQLLFIVHGHGNEEGGVKIYWDSLLQLVKYLEQKSSEIFIYLYTCFSGNAADKWLSEIGENVKVFTTSSCKGNLTAGRKIIPVTNQIFTGFYVNTIPTIGLEISNVIVENFRKFSCTSTIDDLAAAFYQPCNHILPNSCTKMHVHRGGDAKLEKWKILPRNLYDLKTDCKGEDIPFVGDSCPLKLQSFINKEIQFDTPIDIVENVQDTNSPHAMAIVTNKRKYRDKNGNEVNVSDPIKLKYKNIQNFSTILNINGQKCDLEQNLDRKEAIEQLKHVLKLKLGYYKTQDIWILDDNSPYAVDPPYHPHPEFVKPKKSKTETIIVAVLTTVITIITGLFIYYFCYCKKKQRRRSLRQPDQIVVISSSEPQYSEENQNINEQ